MEIKEFEIENIIFDLGGVILDIDIKGVIDKFNQIGLVPFQNNSGHIIGNSILKAYEIGELSTGEFRDELRRIAKSEFSDAQFDKIWNSIILNFPSENIFLIERLNVEYRTFLMSNTNELHCKYFNNLLTVNFPYQNLNQLFEKVYYSHVLRMRKPETLFYKLILEENKLKPESTLFIDDLQENIDAAEMLGIKTLHIKNGSTLNEYFHLK